MVTEAICPGATTTYLPLDGCDYCSLSEYPLCGFAPDTLGDEVEVLDQVLDTRCNDEEEDESGGRVEVY